MKLRVEDKILSNDLSKYLLENHRMNYESKRNFLLNYSTIKDPITLPQTETRQQQPAACL